MEKEGAIALFHGLLLALPDLRVSGGGETDLELTKI